MVRIIIMASILVFGIVGLASADDRKMTIYRSPTCGCCTEYAKYLTERGYDVSVVDRVEMDAVKDDVGVPPTMRSCHTGMIGGYVVEGHVPAEAIARLLSARPKVKGIASPGMPTGSPGMPGPKEVNQIHTFGSDGNAPFMRF